MTAEQFFDYKFSCITAHRTPWRLPQFILATWINGVVPARQYYWEEDMFELIDRVAQVDFNLAQLMYRSQHGAEAKLEHKLHPTGAYGAALGHRIKND